MARYTPRPKGRPKVEKPSVIGSTKMELEDTYYRYLNPKGEKWLFATNNNLWITFIEGKTKKEISKGRVGNLPEEFEKFYKFIVDVRMIDMFKAAIKVDLKTEAEVDWFIGTAPVFGLFIKKVWYGEIPEEHFAYDELI